MATQYAIFSLIAALCLAPSAASAEDGYPIPEGQNGYHSGHIVSGGKFGVRIGDSKADAQRTLEKTFRYDGNLGCASYAREVIACAPGDNIDFFRIQQLFRDGTLFVTYADGRVRSIAWTSELIRLDF